MSLSRMCKLLGISRQNYYQYWQRAECVSIEESLVIDEVKRLRRTHPILGTKKLYILLTPFLLEHQIKIGRDALFELLSQYKLLVIRKKRKSRTTYSARWLKYKNLIIGWKPETINQLWVADITYVRLDEGGFAYLSLLTDAYSNKVVGFEVGESLEVKHCLVALQMAIDRERVHLNKNLIHHSDRGIQYGCSDYTALLEENNIAISMTTNSDPLENPIAERINGIIKDEYLYPLKCCKNLADVKIKLPQIIELYNNQRPHMSIGMNTPNDIHLGIGYKKRLWKTYAEIQNQKKSQGQK